MKYRDQPWELANCRNTDTPSWFPEKGTISQRHLDVLERICDSCEIKDRCLAWATERGERGFWGGQYFAQRMEKDDVDDVEGVHTRGDGDDVSEVWERESPEMRTDDW